jgi:hypothetical protein
MLIHVTPQFLTCSESGLDVELVDIHIPEFGLLLKDGSDIATRRPFANHRYLVGCPSASEKAAVGILVETPRNVDSYTVKARWKLDDGYIVTHLTKYVVLDRDFDGVTDNMIFWYAMSPNADGWQNRWPDVHRNTEPVHAQPRMDLCREPKYTESMHQRVVGGRVKKRTHIFAIPTIERDRLILSRIAKERLPSFESAFHIR